MSDDDDFLAHVRREVLVWLGRYADDDLVLDAEAWKTIEEMWEYSFVTGFNERLKGTTPEAWWNGSGRDYARKAVKAFAKRIDDDRPSPAELEKAFEKARKKLNAALARYSRMSRLDLRAPVICESE